MKQRTVLIGVVTALAVFAVLFLAVNLTRAKELEAPLLVAQQAASGLPAAPAGPIPNTFTYQGRLVKSGVPVSDTCTFQFGLWTAPSGGSQVGGVQTAPGVSVSDGYFSVELNSGNEFGATPFMGEARYLQIAVQCTGDGSPVSLSGRMPLSPAPYAMSLRPGAVISGTGTALLARTSSNGTNALSGDATATTGNASGVGGTSKAPNGAGVVGTHSGSTGGYGVYGSASSSTGRGVYGTAPISGTVGVATSTSGPTWGVYGESRAPLGYGVYGRNTSAGTTYGVYGENNSSSGAGILGRSRNSAGVGVRGETDDGHGVEGVVDLVGGTGYGVWGQGALSGYGGGFENATTSIPTVKIQNLNYVAGGPALHVLGTSVITGDTTGGALRGINTESSGAAYGVYGQTASSSGAGVHGYGANTGVTGEGVFRGMYAKGGMLGISGEATDTIGYAVGVYGMSSSSSGHAGHFEVHSGAVTTNVVGVWAGSYGGDHFQGWECIDVGCNNTALRFRVEYDGDVYADGTYYGAGGVTIGSADFAEMMLPGQEGLEPGDVLAIGLDGRMVRSTSAYQLTVIGVYSTEPGFVAGNPLDENYNPLEPERIPLAVVGVVPVKASAENGAIQPGDMLVASSTPGHAMKAGANPPIGTVIGKALEGLQSGSGVIQMLVILQ